MGIGMFRDGKFDLVVVASHAMSVAGQNAWQRNFEKASELLYNASEGQMQFGRLFLSNNNAGINKADYILDHADEISHAIAGGYRSIHGQFFESRSQMKLSNYPSRTGSLCLEVKG